jgi:HEAT repeat protein
MVALLAAMLLSSVNAEAQSSLRQQVSETITVVRTAKSPTERTMAAMHLCEITHGDASRQVDDESLLRIIALLNTNNDAVRYWVALCLGNFGPRAKPATPKLLEILNHIDGANAGKTSAPAICVALKRIGAEVPPSKCEW